MVAIRPLLLLLFAVALAGAVLSGCASGTAPGDGTTREPTGRTEDSSGPGDQVDGHELPEPPGSTLSYGGETVSAGLGSYCWVSVCADTFAIPVSEEALTVPAGSTLTFAYEGEKLDSLNVSARRIGRRDQLKSIAGGKFLVLGEGNKGDDAIRLHTHLSGSRAHIATDLPAGRYAVEAFARFPEGDAFYGFRVVVE